MFEQDVLAFRNFRKENRALACETLSGDRFQIKQISVKGVDVSIKFSDGTLSKPAMLKSIESFWDAKSLQNYLLKL